MLLYYTRVLEDLALPVTWIPADFIKDLYTILKTMVELTLNLERMEKRQSHLLIVIQPHVKLRPIFSAHLSHIPIGETMVKAESTN